MAVLYIQTAAGLLKISGEALTKEKIISLLGYTPADAKSMVNIIDDESDTYYIADANGNIIMKVDANGVHTTELTLDGVKVSEVLKNINAGGSSEPTVSMPNITDDESDTLHIVDKDGNVIAKIDKDGIHTTELYLNGIKFTEPIDGEDGKDGQDGKDGADGQDGITPHIGDNGNWWIGETDTGVKAEGVDGKDGKDGKDGEDGQDGSAANMPNITDDESDKLHIVDKDGNIIAQINKDGIRTTRVRADEIVPTGGTICNFLRGDGSLLYLANLISYPGDNVSLSSTDGTTRTVSLGSTIAPRIIVVSGTETKQRGEIYITDATNGVNVGHVAGENAFWGAAVLQCVGIVPGEVQVSITTTNMKDVTYCCYSVGA